MRFETFGVLLSLGAAVALFFFAVPIVVCALIALAFSIVAAGGAFALELIHSIPGVGSGQINVNGLPPIVQMILAGLAFIAAIGVFVSPGLVVILVLVRSLRAVCITSLGALALLIFCALALLPCLGADFFLNGGNAGKVIFYFAATAVLHAVIAGLSYYDMRRTGGLPKPVNDHSAVV